jgi:hypothetical protein
MAFPVELTKQAWERASGQCECQKRTHQHFYVPCAKPLVWEKRGLKGWGGWEIKRIDENKGDTLANCEVLCMTCYDINF